MDVQAVSLTLKNNVYPTYVILQYDLQNKDLFCFLWNETEGSRCAERFSSIVIYLLESKENIEEWDAFTKIGMSRLQMQFKNSWSVVGSTIGRQLKNVNVCQ